MDRGHKKSFWALMVTQFFGAFNDNVLKVLVTLLIVQWVQDESMREQLVDLTGVVFVAPFLLFSMVAGRIADRVGKPRVIIATKVWELLVVTVASFRTIAFFTYIALPWCAKAEPQIVRRKAPKIGAYFHLLCTRNVPELIQSREYAERLVLSIAPDSSPRVPLRGCRRRCTIGASSAEITCLGFPASTSSKSIPC